MKTPIEQHGPLEPGARKSSKWLDVARLKADITRLTLRQHIDKRTEKNLQRIMPDQYSTVLAGESVRYNAHQLTLLCAIRALHRGKKHIIKQRVYGPGYPNGSAVVTRPVRIPASLLDKYRLTHGS